MSNTYNLFISHSWTYSDAYDSLINLLDSRPYFFYKNYSVPKDDPIHTRGTDKELLAAIKRQMAPCHCVLMLAGVYSTHSKWINKEIAVCTAEFATKKPIIAIEPWGAERTSQIVKDSADVVVGWNTESIVQAIRAVCR